MPAETVLSKFLTVNEIILSGLIIPGMQSELSEACEQIFPNVSLTSIVIFSLCAHPFCLSDFHPKRRSEGQAPFAPLKLYRRLCAPPFHHRTDLCWPSIWQDVQL